MGFFQKLFGSPAQRTLPDDEWDKIISQMVTLFRNCRDEWFSLCVHVLKDEQALRSNPILNGRAETAAIIYQSIDALEAIAAKQYIEPRKGKDFANQFFAAITEGLNVSEKIQIHKELSAARENGGGDIFLLCDYVSKAISIKNDALTGMKIAPTVPLFTNLNHNIVAELFGDSATVKELKRKRDA